MRALALVAVAGLMLGGCVTAPSPSPEPPPSASFEHRAAACQAIFYRVLLEVFIVDGLPPGSTDLRHVITKADQQCRDDPSAGHELVRMVTPYFSPKETRP